PCADGFDGGVDQAREGCHRRSAGRHPDRDRIPRRQAHAHALRPRRQHAARSRPHRRQQPATAGMTAIEDRMVPRALAMIARHGVSATYANYISSEMTVEGDIEVDEDGDGLNEETDDT